MPVEFTEHGKIKPPASPSELWDLIDDNLTDYVDEVFYVSEPEEFTARLQAFAHAITKGFFPDLVVEIKTSALPSKEML